MELGMENQTTFLNFKTMSIAYPFQKVQDWLSQQLTILLGRQFSPTKDDWLNAPFGKIGGIGEQFIEQLANEKDLIIERDKPNKGLLNSIDELNLDKKDYLRLSKKVVDFYTNTSNYDLEFKAKWNLLMIPFGILVKLLFSNRINQLNIPTNNKNKGDLIKSEIIKLIDKKTQEPKYTIWFRTSQQTKKVIYSGVYGTCALPDNSTNVRAVFPLPQGNATVILKPSVGSNGELILNSAGKKYGDAGFYFALKDSKNQYWSQFIQSFQDKLTVFESQNGLKAIQTLKLCGIKVLEFKYEIEKKTIYNNL